MIPREKGLTLVLTGSSLTTGYLSGEWVTLLAEFMPQQPECKGPITVINRGSGGQTSQWGIDRAAPLTSVFRPTHVLMEDFSINDSVALSGPGSETVSQAQHDQNLTDMVAMYRAENPEVDITLQTMSPVSDYTLRPELAAYYARAAPLAAALNIRLLDHFPGWPNPLPTGLTFNDDGLHPHWPQSLELYLWPAVSAWAKARMAEFWQ